eukprot:CAMPEP_0179437838 /NCGR_PEP_ID=MMETSP0799-20121207/21652_1 /TAXON_ID=46947 /ORGANISM="Geminigera cryophila, Strain CCMP2564" /LENGTH=735 /DNA_ID=CAMNT_0021219017 /DNA_START=155 /DNA_END=2363 /DNA_ORIENTATION=-
MRLQLTEGNFKHTDFVTACGWVGNDLYTCCDDKIVHKLTSEGEDGGNVVTLESFPTDMHWFPSANKKQQSDMFAAACSDGTYMLVLRNGRVEKKVDAHKGAVIAIKWNHEGTAIATAGEDGVVKIGRALGKEVIIKPLQPQAKQLMWKAHDGTVLKVDWNAVNSLIITGGEDRKYKVWDSFGRPLFASKPLEFSVTAVAWSPNGELFGVGLYNSIRLCDRTGWTYSREITETGSISSIAWTSDCTQLAGAGSNGAVVFGQVLERKVEWQNIEALLKETHKVLVHDILSDMTEELDFRDRVIGMAVGFGYLVVTTSLQCCIYLLQNLNTPHIFDLKDTVNYMQLGDKYFLMVDNNALTIYSYEGRVISQPKFQAMRPEVFNSQTVSLSPDCTVLIDHSDPKLVRVFETTTGKEMGKPIQHVLDVTSVSVNRWGSSIQRKCVIQDRNRDLYVVPVAQPLQGGKEPVPFKLGTMCDSAIWNTETDMLAAVMDGKLMVWYYPNVVFIDRDLVNQTKMTKDASDLGKDPQLVHFHGTHVTVRRIDGAHLSSAVSPYPIALYGIVARNMWEHAIQLCRYVKDKTLWACLAVMALAEKELSTAEVAFAAIDEVGKLQYVLAIKDIPTVEGRNAELSLWRRRPDEAEHILLGAKLIYRAIDMNMRLFKWDRALELALHHQTHVDTVLGMRARYMAGMGRQEDEASAFLKYKEGVEINWDVIKKKIEAENEKEANRPGARPYQE